MATRTAKPAAKTAPPKTVDEYIAAAPKDRRAALMKLRKAIKTAAPKATESISYGIVGYKQKGQRLVYFGHWKDHDALYGVTSSVLKAHAAELKPYVQSKGTIQFPANGPLPTALVMKLVRARLAEIDKAG